MQEIIGHYRETLAAQTGNEHVVESLPTTMRAYREAGYSPHLPDDIAAAIDESTSDPH